MFCSFSFSNSSVPLLLWPTSENAAACPENVKIIHLLYNQFGGLKVVVEEVQGLRSWTEKWWKEKEISGKNQEIRQGILLMMEATSMAYE